MDPEIQSSVGPKIVTAFVNLMAKSSEHPPKFQTSS